MLGPARWRSGEAKQRRALRILAELADRYPTVPVYSVAHAEAHYKLSMILTLSGRAAAGRQQLRDALEITEVLAARFPDHVSYIALRFRLFRALVRSYEKDGDSAGVAATVEELRSEFENLDPAIAERRMVREVARGVFGRDGN
jgi:hypothetical protein